jgi:LEA14-like dessication related protein
MSSDYDPPTVTVKSFRPAPSQGAMPDFEIVLNVINPNREPLELEGIAYTVSLNGRDLIKGVGNDLPVIEGYGSGDFTLTASISLYSGIRFFNDMTKSKDGSIQYELEAKLDIGSFRPAIRIKETGDFSMAPATSQ